MREMILVGLMVHSYGCPFCVISYSQLWEQFITRDTKKRCVRVLIQRVLTQSLSSLYLTHLTISDRYLKTTLIFTGRYFLYCNNHFGWYDPKVTKKFITKGILFNARNIVLSFFLKRLITNSPSYFLLLIMKRNFHRISN